MTTLVTFRRATAPLAGRYVQCTGDSSGNSTTTIVVAGLKTVSTATELYTDYYVYLPAASAADKIRQVSSFAPTSGTLTIDRAYSSSSVPNSKAVELHGILQPFSDDLTAYSWSDAINDSLKRLWLPTEFTLTPTVDAIRHSLSSISWVTSENQILDVGYLGTNETRAKVDPYENRRVRGELERDGVTLYLKHRYRTFASTDTIYVRAAKRAYDHCKPTAGAYGDQSGLALETDEAPVPVDVVKWGALVEAARNLRNDLNDAAADHVLSHQAEWSRLFTNAMRIYQQRLPQQRFKRQRLFWVDRKF